MFTLFVIVRGNNTRRLTGGQESDVSVCQSVHVAKVTIWSRPM